MKDGRDMMPCAGIPLLKITRIVFRALRDRRMAFSTRDRDIVQYCCAIFGVNQGKARKNIEKRTPVCHTRGVERFVYQRRDACCIQRLSRGPTLIQAVEYSILIKLMITLQFLGTKNETSQPCGPTFFFFRYFFLWREL